MWSCSAWSHYTLPIWEINSQFFVSYLFPLEVFLLLGDSDLEESPPALVGVREGIVLVMALCPLVEVPATNSVASRATVPPPDRRPGPGATIHKNCPHHGFPPPPPPTPSSDPMCPLFCRIMTTTPAEKAVVVVTASYLNPKNASILFMHFLDWILRWYFPGP